MKDSNRKTRVLVLNIQQDMDTNHGQLAKARRLAAHTFFVLPFCWLYINTILQYELKGPHVFFICRCQAAIGHRSLETQRLVEPQTKGTCTNYIVNLWNLRPNSRTVCRDEKTLLTERNRVTHV